MSTPLELVREAKAHAEGTDVPPQDRDDGPSDETSPEAERAAMCSGSCTDAPRSAKPAVQRYQLLSMEDLLTKVVLELQRPKPRSGVSTCNAELDSAIGGYRPGNVTVFGAKRGFGKTSLGNLTAAKGTNEGFRVIVIAGEDPEIMYGKRFLAMYAGINAMLLRDNKCKKSDWPKITQAVVDASKVPFFWRTDGAPVEKVARVIRELGAEEQVDLVVADYLQCIRSGKQLDRRNEVTYVMGHLCDAVRSIGSAMLLFSQLKRGDREEPELEDLKESGDIEDKADHVLLGWKKVIRQAAEEKVQRWIKVAKNKDGIDAEEITGQQQRWNNETANFMFTSKRTGEYDGDEWSDLDADDTRHP